jgi:hypothetical protein
MNTETNNLPENPQIVVSGKEFKMHFKTETLKDEDGNEVGKGRKHPDVSFVAPVPSAEDVIAELSQDGPVRSLLLDSIYDIIATAAKNQVNEWREKNPEGTFTPTLFDLSKLTLRAIALTPKKERGGWAPSEQDLKDFVEDYRHTMLTLVGYDPKKVGTHCKNFEKGLIKIKNEKPILAKLKEILTIWAARTETMEDSAQTYDWFIARIDRWLKAEEKNTVDAF